MSSTALPIADDARPTGSSTNNFLSDGGDNFPAFKNGTNKYIGGLDIDAFANYLPTVALHPDAPDRITKHRDHGARHDSTPGSASPARIRAARRTACRWRTVAPLVHRCR